MGVKESYDLQSASKRHWEASGIIQIESEGLKTRGVDGTSPSSEAKASEEVRGR